MLLEGFFSLLWWASLALLAFSVFVLVDAALRREDAFRATDKQTKQFWLIILGLNLAINILPIGLFFLQIIGLIAVIVYMVDVRPALKSISGGGGRGRRGGSSSDGPYGPYNGGR